MSQISRLPASYVGFGTVLHSNWKVSIHTYTLSSSSTMVDSRLCRKYSFAIDWCSLVLNDLDAVPPLDRRSLVRVSSCSSRSRGWVWFCDNSVVDFFVASRDSSVPATTSHVNCEIHFSTYTNQKFWNGRSGVFSCLSDRYFYEVKKNATNSPFSSNG